jgi:hypothetical protein
VLGDISSIFAFDADTPVPLINGLTLNDVFRDNSPLLNLVSSGILNNVSYDFDNGLYELNGTASATTGYPVTSGSLVDTHKYYLNYTYISGSITDSVRFHNAVNLYNFVDTSFGAIISGNGNTLRIRFAVGASATDLLGNANVLINMTALGIADLTVEEMNDLYDLYNTTPAMLDRATFNVLFGLAWDEPTFDYHVDLYQDAFDEVDRYEWYEWAGIDDLNYDYYAQLYADALAKVERWEWYEWSGMAELDYDYYEQLYADALAKVERWEWYEWAGITDLTYDDYLDLYADLGQWTAINRLSFQMMTISYMTLVEDEITGTIVLNIAVVVIAMLSGLALMVAGFITGIPLLMLLAGAPFVVAGVSLISYNGLFAIMIFGLVLFTISYAFLGGRNR